MTIYVAKYGNDSNPGTELFPVLTIQKAIDMIQSPDTIIIDDGIYNERIIFINKSNIIIKAKNLGMVILDGSGIGYELSQAQREWGNGLIDIKYSSNINATDLKIQNSLLSGIAIENSESINIKNNSTYNTYSSAIQAHFSNNIIIDNNECELGANAPSTDLVQEIISLHKVVGFEISNNYVHDGGHPMYGGEGINVKAGCSNGTIHNNKVVNVNSVGIYCDGWDVETSNVIIYYNFCKNTGWSGISVSGEIGGTSRNIEINNNICIGNDAGINLPAYNIISEGKLIDINIHNNTLYNNTKGIQIGYYRNTLITNLTIKNNLFSNSQWVNILWKNRDRDTNVIIDNNYFDFMKISQDSTEGSNYIIGGDPFFIDSANDNFNLQANSLAIGYGAYPYPMLCSFAYN